MGYMSEKEFNRRMRAIKDANKTKEKKLKLKEEKNKYSKLKIETHKFLAYYLFIIFNIILIYSLIAMWVFRDFTYLGVLITDIVGQILLYGIYCTKAYKGKQQEELLKFEKEKLFSHIGADNTDNESDNDSSNSDNEKSNNDAVG